MTTDVIDFGVPSDVTLVVGQEEPLRIRANSYILSAASATFKLMFNAGFSEGIGLNFNDPKDVHLPEDDPDAMKTVCQVVHCRTYSLPKTILPAQILSLAIMIDKYFLHETMSLAFEKLFNEALNDVEKSLDEGLNGFEYLFNERPNDTESSQNHGNMLEAAVLLGYSRIFEMVTVSLLSNHKGPYAELFHDEQSDLMLATINQLEVRRADLYTRLSEIVHHTIGRAQLGEDCDCGGIYLRMIAQKMSYEDLAPTYICNNPVSHTMKHLRNILTHKRLSFLICTGSGMRHHSSPSQIRDEIWEKLENIEIKGLQCRDEQI